MTEIKQKILSIDFDYIMFPCIRLYNDICEGAENPSITWNSIKYNRGVEDNFLSYDANTYTTIVKLIKAIVDKDNNIDKIAIVEHQNIIDILNKYEFNESNQPDNKDKELSFKYDLLNIDFHHDVLYRAQDRTAIKNFNKYNCSNWVGYLFIKDKIDKYTWIKAANSDMYDNRLNGTYDIKVNYESIRLISDPKKFIEEQETKFDKIFLCFSPQWVPYQYKHLYDLIVDLFEFRKE